MMNMKLMKRKHNQCMAHTNQKTFVSTQRSCTWLTHIFLVCLLFVTSTFLVGCSDTQKELTVAGSTTVLPIAEAAAQKFEAQTGVPVLVSGLGSSAGIEAVANGTADIATSSRGLTKDEEASGDFVTTVIAHDGIAVIVNPANTVSNISLDQLRQIYAGKITNWKEVGGPDLIIQVVNRDEASGTREAFKTIVMQDATFDKHAAVLPGTGQVRDVVSRTPGAIGYISIGFVETKFSNSTVKSLLVDGIEASEENVADGTYPVSRDLYFFTKGEPMGETKDFIDFVLSPEMDATIEDAGYLPQGKA